MFSRRDDDDDDFMSADSRRAGSKLSSLFGGSRNAGSNESLTYTAPTEPKKTKPAPENQTNSSLLTATAVHAYKYVDGEYKSQGKQGAALIGSHTPPDYKLLLYLNKQQPTCHAMVKSHFTFTVQKNNYASFYDDSPERVNWSVMFDNENSLLQFAKQIVVCRSRFADDEVTAQDLAPVTNSETKVSAGDSVEIRSRSWLIENHAVSRMVDDNSAADKFLRFKVGKGKVIKGLDSGVVGMCKGGRRLLVIPSSLAYGADGRTNTVPPSTPLLYDVEVIRVKSPRDKEGSVTPVRTESPTQDSEPLPDTSANSSAPSDIKSRTRTLSDHMTQPLASDKAKLISRMAKMGQPMLPHQGAPGSDTQTEGHREVSPSSPSHTDTEDVPVTPTSAEIHKPQLPVKPGATRLGHSAGHSVEHAHPAQPVYQPRPVHPPEPHVYQPGPVYPQHVNPAPHMMTNVMQGVPVSSQMSLYQPPISQPPFGAPPYASAYGYPQPAPPPPQPPVAAPPPTDPSVPVLMSETRQQNTEMRLSLSKMADKVDLIHTRLEGLLSQQSQVAVPATHTETAVLMLSIQRIIQENDRLKKEVLEKSSRIESQNDKIAELLNSNQSFVEQSNRMMEQRNDSYQMTATQSQAKLLSLEQEKVQLTSELTSTTSQQASLQLELAAAKKREASLQTRLDTLETSEQNQKDALTKLRLQHAENAEQTDQLSGQLKEEKSLRRSLEARLTTLTEELTEVKATRVTLEKSLEEKKKKMASEVERLEGDLEVMKSQHEAEISSLKTKVRLQKSSTDAATAQQVKDLEEELTNEWQEKCDRLVRSANERASKQVSELREEVQRLETLNREQMDKMSVVRSLKDSAEKDRAQLEEQTEELTSLREKYDRLRGQATTMKSKYETRISELETAVTSVEEERDSTAEERDRVKESSRLVQERAQSALIHARKEAQLQKTEAPSPDAQVKKIMNSVYHDLRAKFDVDQTYPGSDIQQQVLHTIKAVTLKMLAGSSQGQDKKEEESETESEEDEEDEEEEEKEEEEEENVVEKKDSEENVTKSDKKDGLSEAGGNERRSAERMEAEVSEQGKEKGIKEKKAEVKEDVKVNKENEEELKEEAEVVKEDDKVTKEKEEVKEEGEGVKEKEERINEVENVVKEEDDGVEGGEDDEVVREDVESVPESGQQRETESSDEDEPQEPQHEESEPEDQKQLDEQIPEEQKSEEPESEELEPAEPKEPQLEEPKPQESQVEESDLEESQQEEEFTEAPEEPEAKVEEEQVQEFMEPQKVETEEPQEELEVKKPEEAIVAELDEEKYEKTEPEAEEAQVEDVKNREQQQDEAQSVIVEDEVNDGQKEEEQQEEETDVIGEEPSDQSWENIPSVSEGDVNVDQSTGHDPHNEVKDGSDLEAAQSEEKKFSDKSPDPSVPLFADDEDDDGFDFFTPSKPKTPTAASDTKPRPSDEGLRPPPPPLFGESDDDDDLDWLS